MSAPARADEREDARREFAAGQAADQRKDWQSAIEHYLRANDLVPHPYAIFNIAIDYERLGKLREAATWYERYLTAAPDSPDHDKVANLVRELVTRPATISVRSIPPGARVRVDNVPVGATPYSGTIKGGFHRIAVEQGGQLQTKDVNVEYAEAVNADFTLRGAAGILEVRGSPAGALVSVDEMPAGTLPVKLSLAPGDHVVHVTAYGYAPFDTHAVVVANTEVPVDVALTRALGTFDALPSETDPKHMLYYLFGFGAGADVRGNGQIGLVDLGIRYTFIDGSVRIGKGDGLTIFDFIVRAAVTNARLAPFVGIGYSIVSDNSSGSGVASKGFDFVGGIRYDIVRGPIGVTVVVESGIRYLSELDGTMTTRPSVYIPLMATLQLGYGYPIKGF